MSTTENGDWPSPVVSDDYTASILSKLLAVERRVRSATVPTCLLFARTEQPSLQTPAAAAEPGNDSRVLNGSLDQLVLARPAPPNEYFGNSTGGNHRRTQQRGGLYVADSPRPNGAFCLYDRLNHASGNNCFVCNGRWVCATPERERIGTSVTGCSIADSFAA